MTTPKFGAATLAHDRILDKLGAGRMGEVCRDRDTKLASDVALKVPPQMSTEAI